MKEIGIEKLIKLLNEYEKGDVWSYDEEMGRPYYGWGDDCDYEAYLISKKYGFIKWLVENDKIDRSKVLEEIGSCIKISGLGPHYSFYSALLMILAVSDTPIEDLFSYLK